MQAASGADESLPQTDWMDSFVMIMKGDPALSHEKFYEALDQILQNRLKGSSVSQMLTEKNRGNECLLKEIYGTYVELQGIKDVAFRVGLLGTLYMKSLAETMDAKEQPRYTDGQILEELERCNARELYDYREVRNWLTKYCSESSTK